MLFPYKVIYGVRKKSYHKFKIHHRKFLNFPPKEHTSKECNLLDKY